MMEELTLNDGLKIPALGFGTYLLRGISGVECIKSAVAAGYRLIDAAVDYENEGTVGQAVREAPVGREELFIASKLPGRHHAYGAALDTVRESLYRAGLDYYDLYLIHWPNPRRDRYVEAWQALIEARSRGLVRSVGVCNFLPEHLERLKRETGVLPSVNQIELHPYFSQLEQLEWHRARGIVTQAWSPLGRGSEMLRDPLIEKIARAHGKNAAQAILRWHLQHGAVPLPKAGSRRHQAENLDVFDFALTDGELKAMDALTRENGRINDKDPAVYEQL